MESVKKAANLLRISEYKIFSEAYLSWHGDRAQDDEITELFSRFMMFGETPDWADKYARALLRDVDANRQVSLNSYCLLNMAPRVASAKTDVSFTLVRPGDQ